jgi:hypothetical protein
MDLTSRKASLHRRGSTVDNDDDDDDDELEDEEDEPHPADSSGVSGIDVEMADMSNSVTDQSSP